MEPSPIFLSLGPVAIATITPGPSMLLAMDHGLRFGARRALVTALGNVAATSLQATLVMLCLRAVGWISPQALCIVTLLGTLYLGYLGLQMLRTARSTGCRVVNGNASTKSFSRFQQAFFVTFWNPTAYLFFAALFPQFLSLRSGYSMLIFGMILPTLLITFSCMMLYARFGQSLVRVLQHPRWLKGFRIAMGMSFLGLGVWMLLRGL